jgi:hypothetical protein
MNNRAVAWFVAVVFILLGGWLTWDGWMHKKWGLKGVSFRVGGIVALVAGGYSVMSARRR